MGLSQSGQFFITWDEALPSTFNLRQLSQNEWPHPILSERTVLGIIISTVKSITHTVGSTIVQPHELHATLCVPLYQFVVPIALRTTYPFDEIT